MSTTSVTAARICEVIRGAELDFVAGHPSEPGDGVRVADYIAPGPTSAHLTVSIVEFAPGARVLGHLHPFEESFYVLEGEVLLNHGGRAFALVAGDFGVIPIATGHAWANVSGAKATVLRVLCPQPRPIGGSGGWGVYGAPDVDVPDRGEPVDELDPRHAHLGHFDDSDMPPPSPILMPGYHGPNIRNVSIRMMIDELLGARHHTLFVVQFTPTGSPGLTAKEHFHPFEEIYYFVSGAAVGSFDGDRHPVGPGDLIFAPVGASHGFSPANAEPVRWIEAQAPLPPAQNGFVFHEDWAKHEQLA
jgi:quercetin dioxygenase-like cupin family protein